ncbi:DUF2784 domain-containing protein [Bordetella sp. 2513F-2]
MGIYRLLADLTLSLHAAFILFVAVGGVLVWLRPRLAWLHVPAVLWGGSIMLFGGICPLTLLENHWRRLAGEAGYPGGFIEHYLQALIYPRGLTRGAQAALGVAVLVFNLAVYGGLWWRRRRRGRR